MAANEQITLYDLPSYHKGNGKKVCFSFNPWKTRLSLNYKQLPYTTEWVEYPDLESRLSSLGLSPNEPGTAFAPYSSPSIRLPDGTMVMHSLAIAKKLEELYPLPSLHLEAGLHDEAEEVIGKAGFTLWWDMMAEAQHTCLSDRAREYFARTRKEVFGASLEELAAVKGGEAGWQEAEKEGGVLDGLKEFLAKHKKEGEEGPFVLGREVSFADFVVVGLFECFKRCHPPSYERLMRFDKSFSDLHQGCEKWLQRDD